MNKNGASIAFVIVAVATLVIGLSMFAMPAFARPSQSNPCYNCHYQVGYQYQVDPSVTVTVTLISQTATTSTYSVTVTGPYERPEGWAVQNIGGGTNYANGYSPGTFTVDNGQWYRVWGVDDSDITGGGNKGGANYVDIYPTAPDTTGPVTSNVVASPNPTEGASTVTLTADVDDSTTGNSNIAAAEYFVNTVGADGTGIAMSASDGSFDSPTEGVTASIDVSGWAVGDYTLYVHGKDAADNWGPTDSVVLSVTAPPAPVLSADLKKKSAWPEHHHFDRSAEVGRGEDFLNTLYGLVRNTGTDDVNVKVRFTIFTDAGDIGSIETGPFFLTAGSETVLEADFDTTYWAGILGINPDTTKYKVRIEAQAWYQDPTDLNWYLSLDSGIKSFSFAVVP